MAEMAKPFKCPSPDVFDWYFTKIKLMTLENRRKDKCKRLVEILRGTIKDLVELQKHQAMNVVDPCDDEEYELCEDRCVPVDTCEILKGE